MAQAQRPDPRFEEPITVAVGRLGDVIGGGLLQILDGEQDLRVVGAGLDRAALEAVVARGEAQVVVLDEDSAVVRSIPRGLRGGSLGGSALSGVGLVVLAHRPSRARVARILSYGVSVCLSTDASAREIVRGVRLAAEGSHAFVEMSGRSSSSTARALGFSALTRREREVLELLSRGRKHTEVARTLNVSTETARTHAKHIYHKLGVSSRQELLGIEQ
jgi:DNA-binding NarL/FixJ family response regulator